MDEETSVPADRSWSVQNWLTVISLMVLVGAEVFGVALSGGWAIAGLLDLGPVVGYVLMALFSALGVYVMTLLWRRAVAVERRGLP